MTLKLLRVLTVKNFFPLVYGTTFTKVFHYLDVLFNRHVLAFFETSDLKEVHISFFISTIKVQC